MSVSRTPAFFIGLPVPVLVAGEKLILGQTYFMLPAARLSYNKALTVTTLALLSLFPTKVFDVGAASPFT